MQKNTKIVGIPVNIKIEQYSDTAMRDSFFVPRNYITAIEQQGLIPLLIPIVDKKYIDYYHDLCDGFLFIGGLDVDPNLYSQASHPSLGFIEPEMDLFMSELLNCCIKSKKPLLGICRGMQLINIVFGGSLYQDMSLINHPIQQHVQKSRPNTPCHQITIRQDSKLHQLLGKEKISINSRHHQCIDELGKNLIVSAVANDGIIEAIENTDGSIIGVQWHPEDMLDTETSKKLFEGFRIQVANNGD